MPIIFRSLLEDADISPGDTILLRHAANEMPDPAAAWLADREAFSGYQSIQARPRRSLFSRPYWASFVATRDGRTMFIGLFRAAFLRAAVEGEPYPLLGGTLDADRADHYRCEPCEELSEYVGRLFIDWGASARAWVQLGTGTKPITELHKDVQEPTFPGYLELVEPLSAIPTLPERWVEFLRAGRGVYLLTCPRTKEQYVGKADGLDGFWGRWLTYAQTGDGGNIRLKARDRSDYQVSILEVAGSAATPDDILRMETRWKRKLQSREMGLNAN